MVGNGSSSNRRDPPRPRTADSESDPSRLQPRSLDRSRWRGLLHRDLNLRMVSRGSDPSFTRPGPLAARRPPAESRPGQLNMLGDPDSCGVWAPCLTLCRRAVLSRLHRRQALRPDVAGGECRRLAARLPQLSRDQRVASTASWSDPVFLNSSGFDPSLFHDDDGRKYLVNMLWDHRPGRNRFAGIVLQEYSPAEQKADRPAASDLRGHAAWASPKRHISTSATATTTCSWPRAAPAGATP